MRKKKKSVKLLQDLKRMIWNVPNPLKKERGKTRKTEKIEISILAMFWIIAQNILSVREYSQN